MTNQRNLWLQKMKMDILKTVSRIENLGDVAGGHENLEVEIEYYMISFFQCCLTISLHSIVEARTKDMSMSVQNQK